MKIFSIIFILSFLTFFGCNKKASLLNRKIETLKNKAINNSNKITILQGVWGIISIKKGNHMPSISPDGKAIKKPNQLFAQRKVSVYGVVKKQLESQYRGGFIENPNSMFIKETESDKEGFFQLELKEGEYSIFVAEEGLLYNNSYSMPTENSDVIHGYIEVKKGINQQNIVISHQATF